MRHNSAGGDGLSSATLEMPYPRSRLKGVQALL